MGEAGPELCYDGARCKIKLNIGWTEYECTCHVYGQTHKYTKKVCCGENVSYKKPWLTGVQVHLSRLWTDTQVRKCSCGEDAKN